MASAGALALAGIGAAGGALRGEDEARPNMSAGNLWSKDYVEPEYSGPPVYFRNCSEAKARGYVNIPVGTAGYRPSLDGDGDGFACEPYYGPR